MYGGACEIFFCGLELLSLVVEILCFEAAVTTEKVLPADVLKEIVRRGTLSSA